jgi:hypothetical protein
MGRRSRISIEGDGGHAAFGRIGVRLSSFVHGSHSAEPTDPGFRDNAVIWPPKETEGQPSLRDDQTVNRVLL